jgi:hypothetical protein
MTRIKLTKPYRDFVKNYNLVYYDTESPCTNIYSQKLADILLRANITEDFIQEFIGDLDKYSLWYSLVINYGKQLPTYIIEHMMEHHRSEPFILSAIIAFQKIPEYLLDRYFYSIDNIEAMICCQSFSFDFFKKHFTDFMRYRNKYNLSIDFWISQNKKINEQDKKSMLDFMDNHKDLV